MLSDQNHGFNPAKTFLLFYQFLTILILTYDESLLQIVSQNDDEGFLLVAVLHNAIVRLTAYVVVVGLQDIVTRLVVLGADANRFSQSCADVF